METLTTVRYTKLALRKLRGAYQRALSAEMDAVEADVSLEKAWWYAANTDYHLNRLKLAEAGLPLPATRWSKAMGGFKALATIGKIVKKAFQVKAALANAQMKFAAKQAAKRARRALRNVLSAVTRLVLSALPTQKAADMSDYSKLIVLCEFSNRDGFWCLQADGSLYTVQRHSIRRIRDHIMVDVAASIRVDAVNDISEGTEAALFDEMDDACVAIQEAKRRHRMESFGWHVVDIQF